ncbi:MAG: phage tail tape measure protein [Christensenellales bacterium]|nr:phage tail tape measure protein [Christensenellales bacterium]
MDSEGISTKVSVLGDKEYKKALQDIGRQLTVLNTDMAATSSAFGDQADSMDAMKSKAGSLNSIYEAHSQKVKLIAEQLNKAKAEYGENSKQAENLQIALNRAVNAMNQVGNEIAENDRQMSALADSTDTLGNAMESAGEIAKGAMVAGLTAAAAAVAALSAAALEGAKQIVQLGTDYRQAANQLSAQTGATGDELAELGDIAQEVYKNNFGDNIADVNDALATTKVNTGLMGDELKKATENGYLLRDTFGMDIAESSRTASALMQKFGIDAETAYNLIAQGAQRGANQNGDLLDVLSEYAPKYAEMGLSAEDMMTTLISGAENGVFQIDKVGDAVKEFSIRAIDGSDTTKEAFEELGLKASYVSAEISEGGPQARAAFLQVVQALQKVEDPLKRNQLAVSLFGTQFEDLGKGALPILASIAEGGDLSADALEQINEVKYNDAASALEGVKRKIQSEFLPLANNMQSLIVGTLSTIDTALADGFQPEDVRVIGEAIANAMMEGVATIDTLFTENTDIITDMLDSAVRVITEALPALVDAILPAAMGLLQSIVDAITGNIDPLAALASSIVTNVASFLVENASGLFAAATSLVTGLADGIAEALPTLIPAAASMVAEIVTGLAENLPTLLESAGGLLQGIVDGITGALPVLVEALPQIITTITDAITTAITDALPDLLAQGTSILTSIISGIMDAIPTLAEKLPEIITTIITAITEALPDILAAGTSILTTIITGIGEAIPTLVEKMPEVIAAITGALGEIDWLTLGTNLIQGLVDGLGAAVTALLESIKGIFSSIWDAVKEVFGINSPSTVAKEAGGLILDGLLLGFSEAVDAVCETVKKIFGKIWDAIKSIFGFGSESEESKEAKTAGQDIMTGMKDGITGSEEDVKTAVKNASQAVLDTFKTELGVAEGSSTKTKPMGEGIAKGISDGLSEATAETFAGGAAVVANAVTGALNAAFGVEATGFLGSGGDSAKKFEAIGAAVCRAIADGITNNTQNTEAVKTAITGVANAAYEAAVTEMATGITGSSETVNAAVEAVASAADEAAAAILTDEAGGKIGKDFMGGIKQAVQIARPGLMTTTTQAAKAAHDAVKAELSQSKGQSIGSAFVQSIRAGISGQQSQVSSAAQSIGSGALSALWSAVGSGGSRFEAIGNAIAQGMARGIRNGSGSIQSAARAAAQAAYNAAKQELDIRSPSHKMEAIGMQYGAGFAGGIEQSIQDVSRSARMLSEIAAGETAAGAASFPALSQPQIDYERLGEAVAEANRRAGLGKAVLDVNGKRMGETLEPSVSRATYQRAGRTVTGRAARMVLA